MAWMVSQVPLDLGLRALRPKSALLRLNLGVVGMDGCDHNDSAGLQESLGRLIRSRCRKAVRMVVDVDKQSRRNFESTTRGVWGADGLWNCD